MAEDATPLDDDRDTDFAIAVEFTGYDRYRDRCFAAIREAIETVPGTIAGLEIRSYDESISREPARSEDEAGEGSESSVESDEPDGDGAGTDETGIQPVEPAVDATESA